MKPLSSPAAIDALSAPRASACPSLAHVVAARDGGLCRIRLRGGALSAHDAATIAEAAQRHASGVVELTNRANLQLRGVRAGHEAALAAALAHLAADTSPNVMTSPLAGRDPHGLDGTRPLAGRIFSRVSRLATLSPKFSVLLDGGERLMAADHPHDVWFSAMPTADGMRYATGLAGCPLHVAGSALAAISRDDVPAFLDALLREFLDATGPDGARMRDVLATRDGLALLQRAARRADVPLQHDNPAVKTWTRAPFDPLLRIGAHRQRDEKLSHVGGQPMLGRIDARTLAALADLASTHCNATLHITPWQSVLFPDVAEHAVPAVLDGLLTLGFACAPSHPYVRLVACAGSTGCAKSAADTKADAQRLASLIQEHPHDAAATVHLSGCPRSCAAASCAPHTLLAVAPGRYDLYRRDDASGRRFGACVAAHLTIEQAAVLLAQPARSTPDA